MRLGIRRHNLVGLAAIFIALHITMPAGAAISNGPILTNAIAAEEQRILLFHQAEQSYQEQLRVGRERYKQKQAQRAKVIAAMASELQARQQTVMIQPMRAPDTSMDVSVLSQLSPVLAALAIGLICFACGLNRLREQPLLETKRQSIFFPVLVPEPEPAVVSLADAIFFCKDSGVDGSGRSTEEGFMILKGSIGRNESASSNLGASVTSFRTKMFDSGVIREKGDTIIFQKDQLFPTPSMAANTLLGRKTNGWLEWKTKDGMTLDTVQRMQPKVATGRTWKNPLRKLQAG